MWLFNELVLTFSAPIKCTKAQFNLIILSRVMPHTSYRQTDRHFRKNPFFWLRGSQNVKIWWKFRMSFFTLKPIPSHPGWECKNVNFTRMPPEGGEIHVRISKNPFFFANSNRLKKNSFLKTQKEYCMDLGLQIIR